MTEDEAVAKMCEATKTVDWINLGRVFASLGDYGLKWGKFDKQKFKPNHERAYKDRKWLVANAKDLSTALEVLKKNKNAM